jgi:predicted small secreted protein
MKATRKSRFWMWMSAMMVIMSVGMLTACNTMEGAGKDVERTGEAIQDAAN